MMFWILLFFFNSVTAETPMEKFKSCQNEKCILMQCYFPVSEFLNATRNELKVFESFIESNHVFVSYHLCEELSVENIDEVGACIYSVLFKLYQFDANLTVQQRIHVQAAQIQDESIAVVFDMISRILYRIESINNSDELKSFIDKSKREEAVVVINAQSLTPREHLKVSRMILNYGPWFTFVYSVVVSNEDKGCMYQICSSNNEVISLKCELENDIRKQLEQMIETESESIQSYSDLSHVNAFSRSLPTLFYIHRNPRFTPISNKRIKIIPVDIFKFKLVDIQDHTLLTAPYPFYLYWSVKKNSLQRLGDQPSDELIDMLLHDEEEHNISNMYGMIDDEVRYLADSLNEIELNPKVRFLETEDDYYRIRRTFPKAAILFTIRWDSTSKLARRTFHRLAWHLHTYLPMIEIDCFDWTDLCDKENIIQWPTLILAENLTESKTYRGSTNEQEMKLKFAVNQPYEIVDELTTINLLTSQRVIVLAMIQHEKKFLYDTYRNLVDMFRDNEQIFFVYEYTTESSSLIIKQTYGDVESSFEPKTTTYPLNEDLNHLRVLIDNALRIQLIPFNPVDFLQVTSRTFIAASRSQLSRLNNYFKSEVSVDEIPFVWIDTNSPWILTINQYGDIAYPAMIYINFSTGHVYVNTTLTDIDVWIKTARLGLATPFYELLSMETNDGPTQEAIDFINQMNDDQLLEEYRFIHEESEKINENGLGFDTNGLPLEPNT
ncbi:unnamed protein product [Adineta ricciae]|uniref:Uncharacterized protein n=1 Tax=Adineta ricciae TaxID=249248 RepID=A0A814UID9_ADIRI|nr:unnamed protein product [Adineta ricciae]